MLRGGRSPPPLEGWPDSRFINRLRRILIKPIYTNMEYKLNRENLPPQGIRKPRGRRVGGSHSLEGASSAPLVSTSCKGQSATLRASEAVESAIALTNRKKKEESGTERDVCEEMTSSQEQKVESEVPEMECEVIENTQLCDLEVEELAKRAKFALSDMSADHEGGSKPLVQDIGNVVAELIRRAASSDHNIANLRAVNSHLRTKLAIMQKEIWELRREIKSNRVEVGGGLSLASTEEMDSPHRTEQSHTSSSVVMAAGARMGGSSGNDLDVGGMAREEGGVPLPYVDPAILEVTRKVTAAVDHTLNMFLERLRPLENTVIRLSRICPGSQEESPLSLRDPLEETDRSRGKRRRVDEQFMPHGDVFMFNTA